MVLQLMSKRMLKEPEKTLRTKKLRVRKKLKEQTTMKKLENSELSGLKRSLLSILSSSKE